MTVRAAVLDSSTFHTGFAVLNASTLELTKFTGTRIAGTIDCDRSGLLYTSIPQDGNWSVYVDGRKADMKLVGGVMVGVELTEGVHTVEYVYQNEAFSMGWKVSAICLLLFGITLPLYGKRKKGKFEK